VFAVHVHMNAAGIDGLTVVAVPHPDGS
jgi:hypothetical protein